MQMEFKGLVLGVLISLGLETRVWAEEPPATRDIGDILEVLNAKRVREPGDRGPVSGELQADELRAELAVAYGQDFCALPARVARRMKKADPEGPGPAKTDDTPADQVPAAWTGWVPRKVRAQIDRFVGPAYPTEEVKLYKGEPQSLQEILFTAWFSDDKDEIYQLESSRVYRDGLNLIPFVKSGRDRLIYTLDCGGVLATVIQGSGALASVGLAGKLKMAAKSSQSRMVVRGIVSSPVLAAIRGDTNLLSADDRLDILGSLALLVRKKDEKVTVSVLDRGDMVSVARSESDTFQGEASGTFSLQIPGVSGTTSAGASVGRSVHTDTYDIYFRNGVQSVSRTVSEVRERLVTELRAAPLSVERASAALVRVHTGVPRNLCAEMKWEAKDSSTATSIPKIKASWDIVGQSCNLEITADSALPDSLELVGKNEALLGSERKIELSY